MTTRADLSREAAVQVQVAKVCLRAKSGYSITRSARRSTEPGIVMPSVLAVR
jgi:hypothetical protein